MIRSRCFRAALILALLSGIGIPRVEAVCPAALPEQHGIGSWLENCPDTTAVSGSAFLLSNPIGVNSGTNDIVCRESSGMTTQFVACLPEAGTIGDGHVTLQFDWGGIYSTPGVTCPNPAWQTGEAYRTMMHVVESNGRSIILSVGFSTDFGGYVVEGAHPYDESV
ncbi:MAG TPA: hypothetical protein VFQ07_06120, partial [Candidatus Polarisedimenticolia bacterium]|nr:hypothetical protein [Candidatus Polarisedimenticolia bacterium]